MRSSAPSPPPADLISRILRDGPSAWADIDRCAPEDLLDLYDAAVGHRVHLLLAWQLHQQARADRVCPEPVRQRLEEALRREAVVEQVRRRELRRVLDGLDDSGVHPLLFKGAALAFTHYPDPVLRPSVDTDILVRAAEVPDAARALEQVGYRAPVSITAELLNSRHPAQRVLRFKASSQIAYALTDRFGLHHECDLHWHPSIPHAFAHVLTSDALDRLAIAVPALGPRARAFGAVHALTLACIHRVAHHHGTEHLLWSYDIHLLTERLTPGEADDFVRLASASRISGVCLMGLSAAVRRFDTRLPEGCLEALEDDHGRDPDAPSAPYLRPRLRQIDVLRSDFAALGTWRSQAALVWDHVFPPASYIEKTYGVSTRALISMMYARRLVSGAWKWLRPLGRPDAGP
jgi:Uncharacterised nucleotidyltransferase